MTTMPLARNAMYTLLCAGFVALAGCNQAAAPAQPPASSASAPAPAQSAAGPQQAAYTPPTADQLYQLVAPIALFPDKLVAQVLAGATYPDQITDADSVIDKNPNLKGVPLQTAIAQQPWDPSVKGLTVFPSVLDQMAQNIDWTHSLGEAYINDPTDVMNAIQVMRQRASTHGSLRSSDHLTVQTRSATASTDSYGGGDDDQQPVYNGPSVVPAPSQIIEIDPAQSDAVYVPEYNPQVVYGEEVPYYPGYTYEQPAGYSGGDLLAAGAIGFGAAVLVGAIFDHHHDDRGYGWNNWGMNWGHRGGGYNGGGNYGGGQRPAVVYNNNRYVSRSTTVINRNVTNNYNNGRTVNNFNSNNHNIGNSTVNNRPGGAGAAAFANGRPNAADPRGAATTPRFGNAAGVQRGAAPQGVHALAAGAGATHAPMSMPHFNGVPQRGVTTAQSARVAGGAPNGAIHPNVVGGRAEANHVQPANQAFNREAVNRGQVNNRAAEVQRANIAPHVNNAVAVPHENRAASPAAFQQHAARPVEQQHLNQPSRPVQQQHQQAAPREMAQPHQAPQVHREQAQPHPQPAAHQGGGHPAPAHGGKEGKHDHR